ncbi:MAG: hypothetical protein ACI92I_000385 [Acidimicrobiales bacterium]|jgi:hypothetical protein
MRIALLTPLFPPDNTDSAQYVKTLCTKLTEHQVDLFLYTNIPEQIENVTMFPVSKRNPLPIRLLQFTYVLLRHARKHDVLLVQNGPSVELPALLVSFISRTPVILTMSDRRATLSKLPLYVRLHRMLKKRAVAVFADNLDTHMPPNKPDILPFVPYPEKELQQYSDAWANHIKTLQTYLQNVI